MRGRAEWLEILRGRRRAPQPFRDDVCVDWRGDELFPFFAGSAHLAGAILRAVTFAQRVNRSITESGGKGIVAQMQRRERNDYDRPVLPPRVELRTHILRVIGREEAMEVPRP